MDRAVRGVSESPSVGAVCAHRTRYPADVLDAYPKAREHGVVLWGPSMGVFYEWRTADGKYFWDEIFNEWDTPCQVSTTAVYSTRSEALAHPPTVPPPGYVDPKAEPARSTLDRLAEVLCGSIPDGPPWNHCNEPQRRSRRSAAHAVRMAVLREEPSRAELRATEDAFNNSIGSFGQRFRAAFDAARQDRIDAAEKEMKSES